MDEIVVVGPVPDEVLLACGRPEAVPSEWWTPALARQSAEDVELLRGAAMALLEDRGVRDATTGRLRGLLGEVASVVGAVELVLLLELELPDGVVERRSVIAAGEVALLDQVDVDGGVHDLLLVSARTAVELLVALLGDGGPAVVPIGGRCHPDEVEVALPVPQRTATVRMLRSTVGPEAVAHAVTLVEHPRGTVACWSLPDRRVLVEPVVGAEAVVELALSLLGAELEVAA